MKYILMMSLALSLALFTGCCNNTWQDTVKSTHIIAPEGTIPTYKGSYDSIAYQAQKWAVKNLTYTSDTGEYWQTDAETIASKKGDCEDGAILIYSMLVRSGVPVDRVKVVGGAMYDRNGAQIGYHAWCIYKRTSDKEWITLDWCFSEDSGIAISARYPLRMKREYGKIIMYIIGD